MKKSTLSFKESASDVLNKHTRGLLELVNAKRNLMLLLFICFATTSDLVAQSVSTGCATSVCNSPTNIGNFRVEGDLTANYPTSVMTVNDDWFLNSSYSGGGLGVIGTTGNTSVPQGLSAADFKAILLQSSTKNITYVQRMSVPYFYPHQITANIGYILYDAVAARDNHTAGSQMDSTSFTSGGDKNGASPATWSVGISGVPQKNDIIDVGGHLRRAYNFSTNTPGALLGYAFATTRNTQGDSHIDFEIFRKAPVVSGTQLLNTGNDGGHTTSLFTPGGSSLQQPGDLLVSIDYSNGGTNPCASVRVWIDPNNIDGNYMTINDYNTLPNRIYTFTGVFDGGSGSGTYGYAEIVPVNGTSGCIFAAVTNGGTVPATPWGNISNQNATNSDSLQKLQVAEVFIDFSAFGLDIDPTIGNCYNLFGSLMVKTRASGSFTAEMKDFAGPFVFGNFLEVNANAGEDMNLGCGVTSLELMGSTSTPNATYSWSVVPNSGGHIVSGANTLHPTVDSAGCYVLTVSNPQLATCTSTDTVCVFGVPDITAPTVTCLPNITRQCIDDLPVPPNSLQDFKDQGGTAYDISGVINITSYDDSLIGGYCGGTFQRHFTITDECGNATTCIQNITINDQIPPMITSGPSNLIFGCNPTIAPANTALITATDNCTGVTITVQPDVITGDCHKTLVRTYVATDGCGNVATMNQTINYKVDLDAPFITHSTAGVTNGSTKDIGCNPTNAQISAELGLASALDICDGNIVPSVNNGPVQSSGCMRSQTRTWTAVDSCGNQAVPFVRTITWKEDTQVPVINATGTTLNAGCNPSPTVINDALGTATASDNCDNITPTFTDGSVNTNGCLRTQTRTWNATDGCGNNAVTVSRTVTWKVDTQAPVISAGGTTLNAGCNPTPTQINDALGTATASDNCDNITPTYVDGSVNINGCLRSQTRTWSAVDNCGNNATSVSRTITWKVDTQAPVISAGGTTLNAGCNPNPTQINDALGTATASDNCDNITPTFVDGSVNVNGCLRTQTRTWTAVDNCGNTATTVSRTVTWKVDTQAPVISAAGSTLNAGCNPDPSAIDAALGTATASDNCDNVTPTFTDGAVSTNGCFRSQTRTWNAVDACGNTATSVSRTVTWKVDTQAPVISCNQSGNITVCDGSQVNISPTANDDCDGTLGVTCIRSDGQALTAPFPIGVTTVTCSATDNCGNTGSCSITVTVLANPSCSISIPAVLPVCGSVGNTLTATASNADSYSWTVSTPDTNDTPWMITTGANSPSITYTPGSGQATFTLTVTNNLNGVSCINQCQVSFTCQESRYCTYTQGYYGNTGGMSCQGVRTNAFLNILLANPLITGFGGNTLTLAAADIASGCINLRLPGGGTSLVLNGASTCSNLVNLPVRSNLSFKNVLLAQTITLGLNLRIPGSALGNLRINGKYLLTYESNGGGCTNVNATPVAGTGIVKFIPGPVVNFLGANNTVADLLQLANRVLGGNPPAGAPGLTSINNAVASINEAFDKCRFFGGFYPTNPLDTASAINTTRLLEQGRDIGFVAYPNPASEFVNIEFMLQGYDSDVIIEVYDLNGNRVDVLFNANAEADVPYRVQMDAGKLAPGVYFYRFNTVRGIYTDKLTILK